MPRSLKVRGDCIEKVKLAVRRNSYPSQRMLAEEVGLALATVSNFLTGKPVDHATFQELCQRLALDWREIADLDYEVGLVAINYGVPFQAPPLPTYYVDRSEHSQILKTWLLTKPSLNTGTLVITAIHGLGSVGKSTLANALAHDKDVQTHFCDGILWATLGQQPDILPLLSGWVQALGDYNFKATSVEATSSHLRTLLYDKVVLLVLEILLMKLV